jgi:hypothetical protein
LDDAAVPEYLWEEHLKGGSQVKEWDAIALHNLHAVSSWLQGHMLCFWKRKVESSYVVWMKDKYGIKDPATDASVMEHSSENGQKHYVWSPNGRDSYKRWWKDRLITTIEDIVPASDAIACVASSFWLGWDEGSRPFHWRWPEHYQEVICEWFESIFSNASPPKIGKPNGMC